MKALNFILVGLITLAAGNLSAQNFYVYGERELNFGEFYFSENTGGTVTISSTGSRVATGGIQLLGGTHSPAIFKISTDHPTPIEVLVEVSVENLYNNEGHSMTLTSVSPSYKILTLRAGQPAEMVIGGTIEIPSKASPPGGFKGHISIVVVQNNE